MVFIEVVAAVSVKTWEGGFASVAEGLGRASVYVNSIG
jgi:hypothetical protein